MCFRMAPKSSWSEKWPALHLFKAQEALNKYLQTYWGWTGSHYISWRAGIGLLGFFRSPNEMGIIFTWFPSLFLSVECRFKWKRHSSVTNASAYRKSQKWQISLAAVIVWMSNIFKQLGGIQCKYIPTVTGKNIFIFLDHYPEQIPTTPISRRQDEEVRRRQLRQKKKVSPADWRRSCFIISETFLKLTLTMPGKIPMQDP